MRDSRRRRMMLRDEVENDAAPITRSGQTESDERETGQSTYTAGVRVENQPKLIDFVPTRVFVVAGIFLMLVSVISLLNVAHFRILPFADAKGISAGALELSLDRGLLSWVASFLLLATAFFCFQVFQVRRFRADDFSGSYRVWIWLAIGFVIASVDATARISPIVASLISANWESGLLSVDRNVWFMLVGIPALLIAARLVIEIWRSRIAIGSISIVVLAYLFANMVRLDVIPIADQDHSVVEANSVLVAHSFLFFTILCYARFVLLESQGIIRNNKAVLQTNKTKNNEKLQNPVGQKKSSTNDSKTRDSGKTRKNTQSLPQRDDEELDDSIESQEESPTIKLMGQSIQNKKGNRKRKQGNAGRRRAA